MKDHRSRIQRYSERRQWYQVRIQGTSRRDEYDALLRPAFVNGGHYLLLYSRHGKIRRPSSRLFQDIIKENQGKIWVYISIFPLWYQTGIWIHEDEEQWRPRVIHQYSGETCEKDEWRFQYEYFVWRYNNQGLKHPDKIIWSICWLFTSSNGNWKGFIIGKPQGTTQIKVSNNEENGNKITKTLKSSQHDNVSKKEKSLQDHK